MHRFLVPPPLSAGTEAPLSDDAAHHALRVLRLREGEVVEVFDGQGRCARGVLLPVGKRDAVVQVGELLDRQVESNLHVTLAQCVSQGDRMDRTIEKAVELGATRILPLWSARTTVKLDGERAAKRLAHWRDIAVAACMQSGRNVLPEVAEAVPLAEFLRTDPHATDAGRTRLLLSPRRGLRLRTLEVPAGGGCTLLVGPESGLSDQEEDAALAAGFQALNFGPRVLRTETAGPAVIAALQATFGDA